MFLTSPAQLNKQPLRIVSLVPSITELLFYLGLENDVVGVTKFCIHPAATIKIKILVGGTKNINIQIINCLIPDLIIANKEENVKDQVEELAMKFPVWVINVNNIEDAIKMTLTIGELTYKQSIAQLLSNKILDKFFLLNKSVFCFPNIKTAYLIWRKPYMTAGGGTYIKQHNGSRRIYKCLRQSNALPPNIDGRFTKLRLQIDSAFIRTLPFQRKTY